MRMTFTFEPTDGGSRVSTVTRFESAEALEATLAMGIEEGMKAAMGQMDDVLADLTSLGGGPGTRRHPDPDRHPGACHAASFAARSTRCGAPTTRPSSCSGGCSAPTAGPCPSARSRPRWATPTATSGSGRTEPIGSVSPASCSRAVEPYRAVTTEMMIGMDGPGTVNELTLTPVEGGHPAHAPHHVPEPAELRDMVLATGMTDGMETSYARLEHEVLASV